MRTKKTLLRPFACLLFLGLVVSLPPTSAQKLTVSTNLKVTSAPLDHSSTRLAHFSVPTPVDQSFNPIKGLRVLRTISFTNDYGWARSSLAFDDAYAYISTPNGLYRTGRNVNASDPLQLIAFPDKRIINLYVHNNSLYVLKFGEQTNTGPATEHTFLRSTNHGNTFTALDNGLSYCLSGYCGFLTPTVARFVDPLIFLNAGSGRNLLVTKDQGASWSALSGSIDAYVCSEPAFELIDNRVVMGGECPLDFAYVWGGTLQPDLLSWVPGGELKPVSLPTIENRNVQFVERRGDSSLVFAGIEGGLLKSTDKGTSFRFVLQYPISGAQKYPYVQQILYPQSHPDLFIAAGFDKGITQAGYLAYSIDHGESWTDCSTLAMTPELMSKYVAFVKEDPFGRILVGLVNTDAKILTIAEILVEMPSAPILMSEIASDRAVALDSVVMTSAPFSINATNPLSQNQATRLSLFARIADLQPNELPVVMAQIQDAHQTLFDLPVEFVGKVRDLEWLTQVVVRLPNGLASGDARVWIQARGLPSNQISVTIK